jgi:fluoride exporter
VSVALWLGVAALGGAGAVLRFIVDGLVATRLGREFPYGTLVVNLTGAIALGFLVGLAADDDTSMLAGTATLGSYTTFSTWMYETQRLTEDGEGRLAAANIIVSLALGLGAAALGRTIGAHL